MCGIFGVLIREGRSRPDSRKLDQSARLLSHRGPDHSETYVGTGVGLAHTRLALLDPNPRSHQPLWDRRRRYCLVYNGEVYNFRELRSSLQREGVEFRTTGDTEVLLELFVRNGVDASLPELDGMFALAFYDSVEHSVTLARDGLGIKPLYYHDGKGSFMFSSEIKGMRPWLQFRPDTLSICSFLQGFTDYMGPVNRGSFIDGIRALPPGCVMKVSAAEPPQVKRYASGNGWWDPEQALRLASMKEERLIDLVDEELHRSVRMQLDADAPIGVLLSGGLDSSLIAAIARRYEPNLALFHANVVGKKSELSDAARVARHLRLNLNSVDAREPDFLEMLPRIIRHYEFPYSGHPHSVPFYLVSRLAQQHGVKGVLSGEGSDECYLGYRATVPSWAQMARDLQRRFSLRIKHRLHTLLGRAPANAVPAPRIVWSPYKQPSMPYPILVAGELLNRFDRQIGFGEVQELIDARGRIAGCAATPDPRNLQSLALYAYHLTTLLHRNDRLGMAAGVEARFPYLDRGLLTMGTNLPYRCKVRLSVALSDRSNPLVASKWILRRVADRYLPRQSSSIKKRPFRVSAHNHQVFSRGCLQTPFTEELLGLGAQEWDFFLDSSPHYMKVRLMQLGVWADIFLCGESDEAVLSRLHGTVSIQ